jgi:hypothetical protein
MKKAIVLALMMLTAVGAQDSKQPEPRDPTKPDPRLKEMLIPNSGPMSPKSVTFQAQLKALMSVKGKESQAIVEIEGVLHRVVRGSQITVTPKGGQSSVTLKVAELTSEQVRLELAGLGQAIILR